MCRHRWGGKKEKQDWISEAYEKYTLKRQTLKDLSETYGKSSRTLQKYFDRYQAVIGEIRIPSHPVNLVMDATFFHRRQGVLVARANKHNLLWQEIETESMEVYERFLDDLIAAGVKLLSCTIDGKPGVRRVLQEKFPDLPIQFCQFHQVQIVTRYLSKRPKLPAGKELRSIMLSITKIEKKTFLKRLETWHERWKDFLNEKTKNDLTKRWFYTHRRIRSASRSLLTNFPYLFTFQDYPELHIPNTTNSCDGSFAHWKNKLGIHRGLRTDRKKKMMHFFLEHC